MKTIGIEIECVVPDDKYERVSQKASDIGWSDIDDGSITTKDSDIEIGVEFVSDVLPEKKVKGSVEKICNLLAKNKATVNKSCGLHIHIDKSYVENAQNLSKVLYRYMSLEDTIGKFFSADRRDKQNMYIGSLQYNYLKRDLFKFSFDRFDNISKIPTIQKDRYQNVNLYSLREHGTIEFRQHHGTIDAEEINNWVKFITQFVNNSIKYNDLPQIRRKKSEEMRFFKKYSDLEALIDKVDNHIYGWSTRYARLETIFTAKEKTIVEFLTKIPSERFETRKYDILDLLNKVERNGYVSYIYKDVALTEDPWYVGIDDNLVSYYMEKMECV